MFDAYSVQQLPPDHFLELCLYAWGAFLVGGFGLWRYYRRLTALKDTPRSMIRSAAQGYVELQGMAKLMPGPRIVAPLTGKPCVWWRYRIQSRSRSRGSWSSLDGATHDTSTDIFLIQDETGQCVIDPDKSDVMPSAKDSWSGDTQMPEGGPGTGSLFGRYRYIEERIEEGAELCALGYFHTQDPVSGAMIDEEVRQQLVAWKKDQSWLLRNFDTDHDGQIDMQEWDAARQEARRLVLEKERENLRRPPVNLLSFPKDGRQFILSALPRERLLLRLKLLTLASLLLFFAGGAGGTWLLDARLASPVSVNSPAP
ncbi:MAG TPA: hypothetical protein VGM16_09455 [Gammaproteobacteria bacterium]|jgi:hypothetical protein